MNWMNRFKVMPLLVLVAALSFGVRFGEFVTGVSSAPGVAQAKDPVVEEAKKQSEEKVALEKSGAKKSLKEISKEKFKEKFEDEAKEDSDKKSKEKNLEEEPRTVPVPEPHAKDGEEKMDWKDSVDSDLEFSAVKMELFDDLSKRRKDLEGRERELSVREALLKAAEQEIDQKYKELVSLRTEIQDLLVEQSEEEKSRVASLVKIYEGMKPKDAARIFNTLDMGVLLQVVSEMSERKSAPVIASMSPDRARNLTMMLMEQKSLPDLSDGFIQ